MASLILYVTEHCSLCNSAFDLLASMPELAGMPLAVVDIAAPDTVSPATFELLAPKIPVLALNVDASVVPKYRLDWPFTAQAVALWMQDQA